MILDHLLFAGQILDLHLSDRGQRYPRISFKTRSDSRILSIKSVLFIRISHKFWVVCDLNARPAD